MKHLILGAIAFAVALFFIKKQGGQGHEAFFRSRYFQNQGFFARYKQ